MHRLGNRASRNDVQIFTVSSIRYITKLLLIIFSTEHGYFSAEKFLELGSVSLASLCGKHDFDEFHSCLLGEYGILFPTYGF